MINAVFRPIQQWPGRRTHPGNRRNSQFRASYSATLDLLETELAHLGARDIVVQIAVDRSEIRNDGWPRSNARPSHPGVVLSFQSRGKARQFYTDAFLSWEENLRGIALTLQALRAVSRYGCTQDDQQYTGYTALPPGEGHVPQMTREAALAFVAEHSGISAVAIGADAEVLRMAVTRAQAALHPDRATGPQEKAQRHELFITLQKAAELLKGSK